MTATMSPPDSRSPASLCSSSLSIGFRRPSIGATNRRIVVTMKMVARSWNRRASAYRSFRLSVMSLKRLAGNAGPSTLTSLLANGRRIPASASRTASGCGAPNTRTKRVTCDSFACAKQDRATAPQRPVETPTEATGVCSEDQTMTREEALATVLAIAGEWGENLESGLPGGRVDPAASDDDLRTAHGERFEEARTVRKFWQAIAVLQQP